MKKLMLVVLVMLAMVAVNALAVELPITNGGFEVAQGGWGTAPSGWTDLAVNGGYQIPQAMVCPDGGAKAILYSGALNVNATLAFIQTTDNVIVSGQTYTVAMDVTPGGLLNYEGRSQWPLASVALVLNAQPAEGGATRLGAIQCVPTDFASTNEWKTYSFSYVADSTYAGQKLQVYLQFSGRDYGPYVDSVRLSAVPEPATITVLLTGMIGFFLKKRRNA